MNDTICFFLPKKYEILEPSHIKKLQDIFPSLKDKRKITEIQSEVAFWNDPQFPVYTGCIICGELQKYSHSNPAYSYPYDSEKERFKAEYPKGIVLE